jgi:hypothetical protein
MPWYGGKKKIREYLRKVNEQGQVRMSPLQLSSTIQAELTAPF